MFSFSHSENMNVLRSSHSFPIVIFIIEKRMNKVVHQKLSLMEHGNLRFVCTISFLLLQAKTLYYVQKRHRAIRMSEEKINRRRSESPLSFTDAKSTPPKSDVFHSELATALNQSAGPHVGRKNPFLNRGDDPSCDESATDDRLVYLPSQQMDHSRTVLRTSRSWEGPLVAVGDAIEDENEGEVQNDFSFQTPPRVPGIDSSTPVHSSSRSWEIPSDQKGKKLYGGGDCDDMYLTFGTCSLEEPIYANEVCYLEEDQPIFIKPKWVCQEQEF